MHGLVSFFLEIYIIHRTCSCVYIVCDCICAQVIPDLYNIFVVMAGLKKILGLTCSVYVIYISNCSNFGQ